MTVFSSAPPLIRRVMTWAIRNGWCVPIIFRRPTFPCCQPLEFLRLLRGRDACALHRGRTPTERRDRQCHQPQIAHQRPAGDVEVVETNHLRERNLTPPDHLPWTRHPRLEIEPLTRPALDVLVLVQDERTRAHEAHLADDDVEKLRQLVQRKASQELADTCYARVAEDLEHPRVAAWNEMPVEMRELVLPVLGVGVHRAELEDSEGAARGAYSHLPEEDGPRGVDLDHQGKQCEDRCKDDKRGDREREIRRPLQQAGGAREPERRQADQRQTLDGMDLDSGADEFE